MNLSGLMGIFLMEIHGWYNKKIYKIKSPHKTTNARVFFYLGELGVIINGNQVATQGVDLNFKWGATDFMYLFVFLWSIIRE